MPGGGADELYSTCTANCQPVSVSRELGMTERIIKRLKRVDKSIAFYYQCVAGTGDDIYLLHVKLNEENSPNSRKICISSMRVTVT